MSRASERRGPRGGFTLIEVLVVVLVLGILAALVVPNVFGHAETARIEGTRAQIELIGTALDAYRLHNGSYPTTEQGLAALNQAPLTDPRPANWRGPYLRRAVPDDAWGAPFVYRGPGEANPWGFDLLSYGRDGRPGGEGEDMDITSWQ